MKFNPTTLAGIISCYRDAAGKFPDYPTEEEGGSIVIFKEKDPAELQAELEAAVS
jgi:hypothetical protein